MLNGLDIGELAIPRSSAVDVHHNFVQRWNEASERHSGRWPVGIRAARLTCPSRPRLPTAGGAMPSFRYRGRFIDGRYRDGKATPEGDPIQYRKRANNRISISIARRSLPPAVGSISNTSMSRSLRSSIDLRAGSAAGRRGCGWWCLQRRQREKPELVTFGELRELLRWPASLDWENDAAQARLGSCQMGHSATRNRLRPASGLRVVQPRL